MRWGVEHTAPALPAGSGERLAVLDPMRTHDPAALVARATRVPPKIYMTSRICSPSSNSALLSRRDTRDTDRPSTDAISFSRMSCW